jgi:hypothetical protein
VPENDKGPCCSVEREENVDLVPRRSKLIVSEPGSLFIPQTSWVAGNKLKVFRITFDSAIRSDSELCRYIT